MSENRSALSSFLFLPLVVLIIAWLMFLIAKDETEAITHQIREAGNVVLYASDLNSGDWLNTGIEVVKVPPIATYGVIENIPPISRIVVLTCKEYGEIPLDGIELQWKDRMSFFKLCKMQGFKILIIPRPIPTGDTEI